MVNRLEKLVITGMLAMLPSITSIFPATSSYSGQQNIPVTQSTLSRQIVEKAADLARQNGLYTEGATANGKLLLDCRLPYDSESFRDDIAYFCKMELTTKEVAIESRLFFGKNTTKNIFLFQGSKKVLPGVINEPTGEVLNLPKEDDTFFFPEWTIYDGYYDSNLDGKIDGDGNVLFNGSSVRPKAVRKKALQDLTIVDYAPPPKFSQLKTDEQARMQKRFEYMLESINFELDSFKLDIPKTLVGLEHKMWYYRDFKDVKAPIDLGYGTLEIIDDSMSLDKYSEIMKTRKSFGSLPNPIGTEERTINLVTPNAPVRAINAKINLLDGDTLSLNLVIDSDRIRVFYDRNIDGQLERAYVGTTEASAKPLEWVELKSDSGKSYILQYQNGLKTLIVAINDALKKEGRFPEALKSR